MNDRNTYPPEEQESVEQQRKAFESIFKQKRRGEQTMFANTRFIITHKREKRRGLALLGFIVLLLAAGMYLSFYFNLSSIPQLLRMFGK